jgi:hypothetical protein
MTRQCCRWNPDQKMIGLRFSKVIDPSEYAAFQSFENDPASRKWNLWSYIDARDVAEAVVRAPVEGTQSLCSIDKARRLLGWEPQHSWRDHASA